MQTVELPKISIEKANQEWVKYCAVLRRRDDADDTSHLKDLKKVFFQLSKGNRLIDLYESIKQAGKNEIDQPRLGFSRADKTRVVFLKGRNGSGIYMSEVAYRYSMDDMAAYVRMPEGTFGNWTKYGQWRSDRKLTATLPIIPANYFPKGDLKNFYLLWEVDAWTEEPPHDPFLLKRVTKNIYLVLAAWELSEIERAVLKGAFL